MTAAVSRFVGFAGQCIRVQAELDHADRLLDFLFSDHLQENCRKARVTLALVPDDKAFVIRESTAQTQEIPIQNRNEALRLLMDRTIFHLVDKNEAGGVFHAAVVHREGRCVMFPAGSGSGKSTLCAWLVNAGLGYCTDELVFIGLEGNRVQSFARPIIIKNSAVTLVSDAFSLNVSQEKYYPGPVASMVPHRHFNNNFCNEAMPLAKIVYPRYLQGGRFHLRRLSAARSGLNLMNNLVNARNLPNHGFQECTRIAGMVESWELQYSCFEQLEKHVDELFAGVTG